jgi:hypothetical protein
MFLLSIEYFRLSSIKDQEWIVSVNMDGAIDDSF